MRLLVPCDVIDDTMKSMRDMKKRYKSIRYVSFGDKSGLNWIYLE